MKFIQRAVLFANAMELNNFAPLSSHESKDLDLGAPGLQVAVSILIAHEHALCRRDEDAADELLADLEPYLHRMNWAQNEWLRGLSGDLHMLNDEEVLETNEQNPEEYKAALNTAWLLSESASSHANDLLELLRREQTVLTRDMVSFGRAGAYRSLGFPQLGLEFIQNAVRLRPDYLIYQAFFLEIWRVQGEVKQTIDLGLRLLDAPLALPMVILSAVATLHIVAIRLPEEKGRPLLGKARRRTETLLKRPNLDKIILASALLLQGHICWALRRNKDAQKFFNDAIRLDPEDDTAYVAMGLLLQQSDRSEAAPYFVKAIELGTQLSLPFLGLAQYALLNKNYEECKRLSSEALLYAQDAQSRGMANALIGLAILQEFGPTQEARERLRVGAALYPENEAIRQNYDEVVNVHREERRSEAWSLSNTSVSTEALSLSVYDLGLRGKGVWKYGLSDLVDNQRQAKMHQPTAA